MRNARLAFVALLLSCAPEPFDAPRATVRAQTAVDLRAQDEIVIDVAANGEQLVARETPPLPDSDIDRLLTVRWLANGTARAWRFDGEEILEARFVPNSEALLVITRDHKLVRIDQPEQRDGTPVEIDHDVLGPLSIDREGRSVVYVRGEMADYQLVRADVRSATPEALAPQLVPAWSPTIMPDGSEVLFVATFDGAPRLFRVRPGQQPEQVQLAADTPLPTGPGAAVVIDRTMHYQSDGALVSLSLDQWTFTRRDETLLPVLSADRAHLIVHRGTTPSELAP